MLFDLSNDVDVVQQLGKHERSLVADLQPLRLQHYLLLSIHTNHLTSYLPLLNTQMHPRQQAGGTVRIQQHALYTQFGLYYAFRLTIYHTDLYF